MVWIRNRVRILIHGYTSAKLIICYKYSESMIERSQQMFIVQVIAIGILLVGVAIMGYGAYSGYQSSPYLVQVDDVASTSVGAPTSYEDLSPSQKEIFDRITTDPEGPVDGQAAHVDGNDLMFYANNVVEYQGEYYTFELHHDPGTLTPLVVGIGGTVAGFGVVVLLGTQFVYRRRTAGSDTRAT